MIVLLFFLFAQNVVENDFLPKQKKNISLHPVQTIGDGEDLLFAGALSITYHQGELFVLDRNDALIYVFDDQGHVLRKFGKRGRGPGELKEPDTILFNEKGELLLFDTGRKILVFYDVQGVYLRQIKLDRSIQKINKVVLLKDQFALSTTKSDQDFNLYNNLSLYNENLEFIHEVYQIPFPKIGSFVGRAGDSAFWVDFLKANFVAITQNIPRVGKFHGQFISATSDEYNCRIHDKTGKVIKRITKKRKPKMLMPLAKQLICEQAWQELTNSSFMKQELTPAIFEKAFDSSELVDMLPKLNDIIELPKGFAVLTNYDPHESKGFLDVFDERGQCIAILPYHGVAKSIISHQNKIIATGTMDDEIQIQIFEIKGL